MLDVLASIDRKGGLPVAMNSGQANMEVNTRPARLEMIADRKAGRASSTGWTGGTTLDQHLKLDPTGRGVGQGQEAGAMTLLPTTFKWNIFKYSGICLDIKLN